MVNVLSPLVVIAGPVSEVLVDICTREIPSQVSASVRLVIITGSQEDSEDMLPRSLAQAC